MSDSACLQKIVLPPSVVQGAVFYSKQNGVTNTQPHRLIVMNLDPHDDEIIILNVVSSKILDTIDRIRKQKEDLATAVDVSKCIYGKIGLVECDSIVNCNEYKRSTREEFFRISSQPGALMMKKIPEELLQKLINGMKLSNQVKPVIKKMVGAV